MSNMVKKQLSGGLPEVGKMHMTKVFFLLKKRDREKPVQVLALSIRVYSGSQVRT